jgi:crossover junction endodeoxyribonuclease RuvC
MRALGIDPGTRYLGWGVIDCDGNRMAHVAHGVIHADEKLPLAERLRLIEEGLIEVLEQHRPVAGSVETLFFHRDAQAAAKLGHARGVVLLCLQRAGVRIAEYAPALVKRSITGNGRAGKEQVALMVKALLCLDQPPPSDAADALALAVTHVRRGPIDDRLAERVDRDPQLAALLTKRRKRSRRARL